MIPIYIITGGINLAHLVKIIPTGFLHYTMTNFMFLIDKYLERDIFSEC